MSCLPPFISGTRTFKTLAGLERAIARFDGELLGFSDGVLRVKWPAGVWEYPITTSVEGGTVIELQLQYDLT
jgi:hypothetical protein